MESKLARAYIDEDFFLVDVHSNQINMQLVQLVAEALLRRVRRPCPDRFCLAP